MIGVVLHVDSRRNVALISVTGASKPVLATFSEVRNTTPRQLDGLEVVEFTLQKSGDELRAKNISVLIGRSEREAVHRMTQVANGSLRRGNDKPEKRRDRGDTYKPRHCGGSR